LKINGISTINGLELETELEAHIGTPDYGRDETATTWDLLVDQLQGQYSIIPVSIGSSNASAFTEAEAVVYRPSLLDIVQTDYVQFCMKRYPRSVMSSGA